MQWSLLELNVNILVTQPLSFMDMVDMDMVEMDMVEIFMLRTFLAQFGVVL